MFIEVTSVILSVSAAVVSLYFSIKSQKSADIANALNSTIFKSEQSDRIRKLVINISNNCISDFRDNLKPFLRSLKDQGYSRSEIHSLFTIPSHLQYKLKTDIDQSHTDAYLAGSLYGIASEENMKKLKNEWQLDKN